MQKSSTLLLALVVAATRTTGFLLPSSISSSTIISSSRSSSSSSSTASTLLILGYASPKQRQDEISADEMRKDIEEMRQEAMKRLEALNEKLEHEIQEQKKKSNDDQHEEDSETTLKTESSEEKKEEVATTTANLASKTGNSQGDRDLMDLMEQEKQALDNHVNNHPQTTTPKTTSSPSSPLKLMDDTRWRLMLNVGREPGTWMPQTWGVSGERLYLNLELEFSSEQLYEREEFLNGIAGTKVLKVSKAYLAPSMKEGGKQIRIKKTGGWRVAPGEGPLGTTVLRFYVELEELVHHHGSDVYCPQGRVYCTCGYFNMKDRGTNSLKDALKKEQEGIVSQYEQLSAENEQDEWLVSWGKLQRSKKMMELKVAANKLAKKMNEAAVREPDKSILRLSQDQKVGLTREGGVCCKVQKGLAIEYHILGKFEIASMANRDHQDYRELLP